VSGHDPDRHDGSSPQQQLQRVPTNPAEASFVDAAHPHCIAPVPRTPTLARCHVQLSSPTWTPIASQRLTSLLAPHSSDSCVAAPRPRSDILLHDAAPFRFWPATVCPLHSGQVAYPRMNGAKNTPHVQTCISCGSDKEKKPLNAGDSSRGRLPASKPWRWSLVQLFHGTSMGYVMTVAVCRKSVSKRSILRLGSTAQWRRRRVDFDLSGITRSRSKSTCCQSLASADRAKDY